MRPRLLVVLGAAVLLLVGLAVQAWFDPGVPFLRPSRDGAWLVHPEPPLRFIGSGQLCPDLLFRHQFSGALTGRAGRVGRVGRAGPAVILVTALTSFVVSVNGRELQHPAPPSWKAPTAVDLSPYLVEGLLNNELRIRVSRHDGPPALLVEGPTALRSGPGWTVSVGPDFASQGPAALAQEGEAWLESESSSPRNASPWFIAGMAAVGLLVLSAAMPSRFGPWWRQPEHPASGGFFRRHAVCLVLLSAAAVWQLHNALHYEAARGCDQRGHVEYVRYVAENLRLPTADMGWEMLQPPLYYVVSAAIWRTLGGAEGGESALRGVRILGGLAATLHVLLAWLALCAVFPDSPRRRSLGLAAVALIPATLLFGPLISNEGAAALVSGIAILLAVKLAPPHRISLRQAALLGAICGLAMLSKYTGTLVAGSVVLALLMRRTSWHRLPATLPFPPSDQPGAPRPAAGGAAAGGKGTPPPSWGGEFLSSWRRPVGDRRSMKRVLIAIDPGLHKASIGSPPASPRSPSHPSGGEGDAPSLPLAKEFLSSVGGRAWGPALTAAAAALAVGGWYYARNLLRFGTAFPAVWNGVLGFRIAQFPGYATLSFFTRLGGSLLDDRDTSVLSSFWDGLYATLWTGVQSCAFLDREDPAVLRLEAVILWLAVLPTAAMVLGLALAVRRLVREGWDDPYLVPVLTSFSTVAALLQFNLQVPLFSSVKARYLWPLLIPAALFAALGLDRMAHRLGSLRWLLYAHLTALSGLILYLYWYRLA